MNRVEVVGVEEQLDKHEGVTKMYIRYKEVFVYNKNYWRFYKQPAPFMPSSKVKASVGIIFSQ